MKLDRGRPFAEVHGGTHEYKFMQDGIKYDAAGDSIEHAAATEVIDAVPSMPVKDLQAGTFDIPGMGDHVPRKRGRPRGT